MIAFFDKVRKSTGRAETRILVEATLMILLFWGVAYLISTSQTVTGFDSRIMASIYDSPDAYPLGSKTLLGFARDITSLGGPALLILATFSAIFWVAGHRDKAAMWFLIGVMVGATILSFALKALIGRDRPDVAAAYILESTKSFPSGHSLLSTALYPTVAIIFLRQEMDRWVHRAFLIIGILVALLVGTSRVILGAHYPSDVLAGWAAGFGWVGLCRFFLALYERPDESPPTVSNP